MKLIDILFKSLKIIVFIFSVPLLYAIIALQVCVVFPLHKHINNVPLYIYIYEFVSVVLMIVVIVIAYFALGYSA